MTSRKCGLCHIRVGKERITLGGEKMLVCKRCRREFRPTPAEEQVDFELEERRAEFQAELGAGCFDLP